jgi:RluA family pseudouridine synthase
MIHRLDKETSGVVVLARNAHAHQILNDQFSNRAIQKEYRALVFGTFPQTLNVSFQLRINADRRHRTRVDPINGKASSTDFSLIENIHNSAAYISASPHTGYTHQIRAHLLSAGFPILGDPLYNSAASRQFSKDLPIQRTALHAYQITFIHPLSGELITFHAEIPLDMQESLEFLNKN